MQTISHKNKKKNELEYYTFKCLVEFFSLSPNLFNLGNLDCWKMYSVIKSKPPYTKLTLTTDAAKGDNLIKCTYEYPLKCTLSTLEFIICIVIVLCNLIFVEKSTCNIIMFIVNGLFFSFDDACEIVLID